MNYLILITEESKPVLVEVPQKPKHSYGASRSWEELDYKSKIDRVISDKSKHIQLKRNDVLSSLLVGAPWPSDKFLDGWLKERSGQTFPLPENINLDFEYQVKNTEGVWVECDNDRYEFGIKWVKNNPTHPVNVRIVAILSKLEEPYVVAKLEIPAEAVSKLESVVAPSEEVKQGEWISVDDRLPEVQTAVLIFCGGFSNPWLGYYRPSSKEWYMYYASGSAVCDDRIVTHWMKMPTPPKVLE